VFSRNGLNTWVRLSDWPATVMVRPLVDELPPDEQEARARPPAVASIPASRLLLVI
jgi:hypothetical protein